MFPGEGQVLARFLSTGSPADLDQLINGLFVWKFKKGLADANPHLHGWFDPSWGGFIPVGLLEAVYIFYVQKLGVASIITYQL